MTSYHTVIEVVSGSNLRGNLTDPHYDLLSIELQADQTIKEASWSSWLQARFQAVLLAWYSKLTKPSKDE